MSEDEVGIMWEKRRGGSAGGAGRGTVGRRVGPPVSSPLKYCETCIVNPLLTDVLRFCLTRWSVLFRIALWDCFFWTLSLFLLAISKLLRQLSKFVLVSSPTVQLDIKGAFHLPRNSGNSVWDVNGTHVFKAFHWKVAGNKWNFEKVVLFCRWKLSGGNACSIYEFSVPGYSGLSLSCHLEFW